MLDQLDVIIVESLMTGWMAAQEGVAEVDNMVADGKTLMDTFAETSSGAARFISRVRP